MKQPILRSVLWSAYGDALGFISERRNRPNLPSQYSSRRRNTSLIPWTRRIGGQFGVNIQLPAGCYSDDTQLRLATFRSIRGNGEFDVEVFGRVELPVWVSYALGAGRGSTTAAESLRRQQIQWNWNFYDSKLSRYVDGGGNGAAMRVQPHVWCANRHRAKHSILRDIIRNTITTHGHMRAIVGAAFHAMCLWNVMLAMQVPDPSDWLAIMDELKELADLIRSDEDLSLYWLPHWESVTGQTVESALHKVLNELKDDIDTARRMLENSHSDYEAGKSYSRLAEEIGCLKNETVGSAPKTALLASYLSYAFAKRTHEGIIESANLIGSDTDTIATMAGAIMGVVAESEPPEEVRDLDYFKKVAEALSKMSDDEEVPSHPYPDLISWKPPASQIDTMGKLGDRWVLQGLGEAIPIDDPVTKEGKNPTIWQWFRLDFGQTVLVKRRQEVKVLSNESLLVKPPLLDTGVQPSLIAKGTSDSGPKDALDEQGNPNRSQAVDQQGKQYESIDIATDRVISSGFQPEIVGSMLMKLAEQEDGIEKSIAFAAIVAKARQARIKREKRGSS
jgi:ADP-ribosylglycohydrolase